MLKTRWTGIKWLIRFKEQKDWILLTYRSELLLFSEYVSCPEIIKLESVIDSSFY